MINTFRPCVLLPALAIAFFSLSVIGCNSLEPSEEQMLTMADEFVTALGLNYEERQDELHIVPWFGDDATPSSYIVTTYSTSQSHSSLERIIRERFSTNSPWLLKEKNELWYMEELPGLSVFCATQRHADEGYIHSPFDNSLTILDDGTVVIRLYINSPAHCRLEDAGKSLSLM